jgi:hypothetical protein
MGPGADYRVGGFKMFVLGFKSARRKLVKGQAWAVRRQYFPARTATTPLPMPA